MFFLFLQTHCRCILVLQYYVYVPIMKVNLGIGMSREKFHTPIDQILCDNMAFGIVNAAHIANGGRVGKTRFDLGGIFLVDAIKIGSHDMFHGGCFGGIHHGVTAAAAAATTT